MIAIRHLTGPLAGQTQSFDDGKEKIEFGRESDCDVVYPAEETRVGRRHLALVRELNDWVVHIHEGSQGAHFVRIKPAPAEPGLPIASGSIFHLGRDDGPSFGVAFDQSALAADLGKTSRQEKITPTPQLVRRLAIAGGLAATLLTVAVGWSIVQNRRHDQELAATVASLAVDQKNDRDALAHLTSVAAASIDQNIINRMRKATFLVVEEDAQGRKFGMGTAWAIGPDVLATNAHIAGLCDDTFSVEDRSMAECNELKPGEKMLVVQPGPGGASYRVVGHSYHPGYTAFPKFVMGEDPAFIASFRGAAPSQITGSGYDVGLLRIDGRLPPELALQLASEAELLALEPGMPLASSGYPYENVVGQDMITVAATPQIHYGNISALTDFLFLPTTPAHSYLVQHSIPETGGGSGSLIVGASGHIVAINNAGNFGPRGDGFPRGAPSGVQINYAQRADIIADLYAGRAQSAFDADKPYWSKQLANFKRGVDVIGDWVLERAKPDEKSVAQIVSTKAGALDAGDMRVNPDSKKKQRVKVESIDASAGVDYFVFVYAERKTPIAIYIKDADNQTQASNTNSGWYPSVAFKPARSGPLSLIVIGPDDDTAFTTKIYTWRRPGS